MSDSLGELPCYCMGWQCPCSPEESVCYTDQGWQVDIRCLCEGARGQPWDQSPLESVAPWRLLGSVSENSRHEAASNGSGSNHSPKLKQGWPDSVSRGDDPDISRVLNDNHSPSCEPQPLPGPLQIYDTLL